MGFVSNRFSNTLLSASRVNLLIPIKRNTFNIRRFSTSSQESVSPKPRISERFFGKSNEIRLVIGVAGVIIAGCSWAISQVATKTELDRLRLEAKTDLDSLKRDLHSIGEETGKNYITTSKKLQDLDTKLYTLTTILLDQARHEANQSNREVLSLREENHLLKSKIEGKAALQRDED